MRTVVLLAFLLVAAPGIVAAQAVDYKIDGDGIPQSLTGKPGVVAHGKALLARRDVANCLECHSVKDKDLAGGGTRGPALDGIGAVLTAPQLRLSVVDIGRVSPTAGMPSFHKAEGLIARSDAQPKLSAQEIEDIVAYLSSLKK
jgi:L-cysteine S-thiosulfotransferase